MACQAFETFDVMIFMITTCNKRATTSYYKPYSRNNAQHVKLASTYMAWLGYHALFS